MTRARVYMAVYVQCARLDVYLFSILSIKSIRREQLRLWSNDAAHSKEREEKRQFHERSPIAHEQYLSVKIHCKIKMAVQQHHLIGIGTIPLICSLV